MSFSDFLDVSNEETPDLGQVAWGAQGSLPAGLNRSLLDAAPGGFLQKLRYKAEEAGSKFIEIPTRAVKPTQRCHCCGAASPKRLDERRWRCACGADHDRDENAARTMLRYAYEGAWWDNNGSGTDPGAQTAPRNSIQAQAWVE